MAQLSSTKSYLTDQGRYLYPGTEFSVVGERGARFRFINHTVNGANGAEWITAYGGTGWRNGDGLMVYRSFDPATIKRVHRKDKIR